MKLENILITNTNIVKIIDFGFATNVDNLSKMKMYCGTPSYMAPEIIKRKNHSGCPADIWALGIILYAMLAGTFPFKGSTEKELF